jgi:hypothetical protein
MRRSLAYRSYERPMRIVQIARDDASNETRLRTAPTNKPYADGQESLAGCRRRLNSACRARRSRSRSPIRPTSSRSGPASWKHPIAVSDQCKTAPTKAPPTEPASARRRPITAPAAMAATKVEAITMIKTILNIKISCCVTNSDKSPVDSDFYVGCSTKVFRCYKAQILSHRKLA